MHVAIRAAGFSLMTMFVSCGVGAQDLDMRIGKISTEGESPAHESIARLYAELDFQQAVQSYLWALPVQSQCPVVVDPVVNVILNALGLSSVAAVEQREAAFGDEVVVNPANTVFL